MIDAIPGAPAGIRPHRFDEWMRARLRARRLSQRELARRSGVSHATISRIIAGHREPSLATVAKLLGILADKPGRDLEAALLESVTGVANPIARIEYALRADEDLTEADVREIMGFYLTLRRMPRAGAKRGTPEPTSVRRVRTDGPKAAYRRR
ncbi:MAG TPA: helix-turn-helix domain-containing protein [Candidatus Acidoferrum sp.]|nr:helix-turn-helix domain-containing protein [Candidatus Acidoferrum sp.]